jgi:ubiquinone/menaquinone biosynthesis C-methylase UbiE
MAGDSSKDIDKTRKMWDERAERYDKWYQAFQGAVEHHVDLEVLKKYLPEDRGAKILDAAGGTGRITLPLAEMGYPVTLCDISLGMLGVARRKLREEGVADRANILECDVRALPFQDESFDFVLCWNGMAEAAGECVRVTKKGGKISIFLVNKWSAVINGFYQDPASTLALIESSPAYLEDKGWSYKVVSAEEARELFEERGVRVLDTYAACGWMSVLSIPEEVGESRDWDKGFFEQTVEMVTKLCKEPSVSGMSRHLVLYGEKG